MGRDSGSKQNQQFAVSDTPHLTRFLQVER